MGVDDNPIRVMHEEHYETLNKLGVIDGSRELEDISDEELLALVQKVSYTKFYSKEEVLARKEAKARNKYLRGEITEQEYKEIMVNAGATRMTEQIEEAKAEKYAELREKFIEDEITEEEYEEELDELFESGEDFLDIDPDATPPVRDEVAFRAKEIAQIVGLVGATIVAGALILLTQGRIIPLLFVLVCVAVIIKVATMN